MTSRRRYKIWKRFTREIRERVAAVVYTIPDPLPLYSTSTSRESERGFCPLGEAFGFKGINPEYLVGVPGESEVAGMLLYGNPYIDAWDKDDWDEVDKYAKIQEEASQFISAWDNNEVSDLAYALYLDKENDCV